MAAIQKIAIYRLVFFLLVVEMVLGGGGRVFVLHGISLRYALFFLSLFLYAAWVMQQGAMRKNELFLSFFVFVVYGSVLGIVQGASFSDVFFDVQPLLYALVIFPLVTFAGPLGLHAIFEKVLQQFAKIAAIGYLAYAIPVTFSWIDPSHVFDALEGSTEIFFRPGGYFFYKGFFFLGLGAVYFFYRNKYMWMFLTLLAVFMTGTRGILLAVGISIILLAFLQKKTLMALAGIAAAVVGYGLMLQFVGDRGVDSDAVRLGDMGMVLNGGRNILEYIFGAGFGSAINGRGRIEIVYLEMFYKTGVFAFFFFALVFAQCATRALRNDYFYFTVVIYVFMVSVTNPLIFTPMGIFLLSMAYSRAGSHDILNNSYIQSGA